LFAKLLSFSRPLTVVLPEMSGTARYGTVNGTLLEFNGLLVY